MKKIICMVVLFALLTCMISVYADATMKVYAPDGRVSVIKTSDFEAWKKVGWYGYPVMKVYSIDGRVEIINKNSYDAWHKVGWYNVPVMQVYSLDGRVEIIDKAAYTDWRNVGWYDAPVMMVYSADGREKIIKKKDFDSWSKVGWYSKPVIVQTIYANKIPFTNSKQQWAVFDLHFGPYGRDWRANRNYYINKYFSSLPKSDINNIHHYSYNQSKSHIYLFVPRYNFKTSLIKTFVNFEILDYEEYETLFLIKNGLPFSVQLTDPAGDFHPIIKVKSSLGTETIIGQNLSDWPELTLRADCFLDLTEGYYSYD